MARSASSGISSARRPGGRLCLSSDSSGARTRAEVGSGEPQTLRTLRPRTGLSGTGSSSPAAEVNVIGSVQQTIR